jgi:arsenite methyltransferase
VGIGRGDATALPFPDGAFDAAAAVQVYAYVEDLDMALAELFRVLRPGGRAVVLDTDLDSMVWHAEARDAWSRSSRFTRSMPPIRTCLGFWDRS